MLKLWAGLCAAVGLDGFLFIVALLLITAGLWPWCGWGALLVPGAVLLWVVVPSRSPLVTRPPDQKER